EFRDAPRATTGVIGPYLSPEDRLAIIEYMKVMNDVAASGLVPPVATAQRNALLDLIKPDYEGKRGFAGYEPADKPLGEFCRRLEDFMRKIPPDQNYIASPAPGFQSPAYGYPGAPAYEYVGAPAYGHPAAPAANGSASKEGREP